PCCCCGGGIQQRNQNGNQNSVATTTTNTLPQGQQQQQQSNNTGNNRPRSNTRMTTSAFRRRQNRLQQQQQQQRNNNQIPVHQNPFDTLAVENNDKEEPEVPVNDFSSVNKNKKKKNNNNNKKKKNEGNVSKTKHRPYLNIDKFAQWLSTNSKTKEVMKSSGNQCFALQAAPIYDEWIRSDYEVQVWRGYKKLGITHNHWAKEVVNRTKTRKNDTCIVFVDKKINHFQNIIDQAHVKISKLQHELGHYWSQIRSKKDVFVTSAASTTTTTTSVAPPPSLSLATTTNNDEITPWHSFERLLILNPFYRIDFVFYVYHE
ncbi:unnamed protein product, partial [Adineta ricciae]